MNNNLFKQLTPNATCPTTCTQTNVSNCFSWVCVILIFFYFLAHDNQGGQWLVRKGEFHVGSHINSMFRLKCNVPDPNIDKRSNLADKRQVTYFCKYLKPVMILIFYFFFLLKQHLMAALDMCFQSLKKHFVAYLCFKMH